VAKEVAIPSATNDTRYKTCGTVATVLRQDEQLSEAALMYTDEIDSDKKDLFAPFREYLIQINLRQLIPLKFQQNYVQQN
jgi:hypothetical protein